MKEKPQVRVLFDDDAIAERVEMLAGAITAQQPRDLLVVAILKGSFVFAADLVRGLHRAGLDPQIEFMHLSSYLKGTVSIGQVQILKDIDSPVAGRDVLILDDILESGRTLAFAKDLLKARGARRVMIAVMLEKPGSAPCRCRPISSGSNAPTSSSWATAWMPATSSGSCRSSASSKPERFPRQLASASSSVRLARPACRFAFSTAARDASLSENISSASPSASTTGVTAKSV